MGNSAPTAADQHDATKKLPRSYLQASMDATEQHYADLFEPEDDADTSLLSVPASPAPSSSSSAAASSSAASSSSSSSASSTLAREQRSVLILSKEQVAAIQSRALKELQSILGEAVSLASISVLMQSYNWVSEDLINDWIALGSEACASRAGVDLAAPFDAAEDEIVMNPNWKHLKSLQQTPVQAAGDDGEEFRARVKELLGRLEMRQPDASSNDCDSGGDDDARPLQVAADVDPQALERSEEMLRRIAMSHQQMMADMADPLLDDNDPSRYAQAIAEIEEAAANLADFELARSFYEERDEERQLVDAQYASLASHLTSLLASVPVELRPSTIQIPSAIISSLSSSPASSSSSSSSPASPASPSPSRSDKSSTAAVVVSAEALHSDEYSQICDELDRLAGQYFDARFEQIQSSVEAYVQQQQQLHAASERKRPRRRRAVEQQQQQQPAAAAAAASSSAGTDSELTAALSPPGSDPAHSEPVGDAARTPMRSSATPQRQLLLRSSMEHSRAVDDGDSDSEVTCSICFDTVKKSAGTALSCGHWFCNQCWKDSWDSRLSSAEMAMTAGCLAINCPLRITKVQAKRMLAGQPDMFERYERFFINTFVEKNPSCKWCPSPTSCDYIALYADPGPPPPNFAVLCRCGFSFCFACSLPSHRPANCDQTKLWLERLEKEGGTASWTFQNTKRCPKCQISIEKNEGCLHMTCKCRHEFCWLCLGPWSQHGSETGGYFRCNVYDPKIHDQLGRSNDPRYFHHVERWEHHDTAIQFAKTQKVQFIEALSDKFRACHPGWSGDFLWEAFYLALECRQLLKYTYVASFYLPEDYKDIALYQFLQGNLESHTDKLYQDLLNFKVETDESSLYTTMKATRHYFESMTAAIEKGLSTGFQDRVVIQRPNEKTTTTTNKTAWDWFAFLKRK